MFPPPLSPEVFDALPAAVQVYLRLLESIAGRVETLSVRVADLEARLNQNSSNSSKPPSSDSPSVKPAPPKPRSGKKRGGQPGHPKHERTILPPDEIHEYRPTHCSACRGSLRGDDPEPVIEQVIELPVTLRHVVHYRRHTLTCSGCGTATTAPPVPEAEPGFGPRLQALVAYLSGVGRMGKRPIRQLCEDLLDIPLSLGSVCGLEARTSRALEPIHVEAKGAILTKDANVDETGWKQGGKKAWLWVAVTGALTVFLIHRNRNREAFEALVGPERGVLTTDRFSVYQHLPTDQRQVCWAHLRRDFQAMIDRRNAGSGIGDELLAHAQILLGHWKRVRDADARGISVPVFGLAASGGGEPAAKRVGLRLREDRRGLRGSAGVGGVAVDVRVRRRRGADEQRGRASGASRGVLAEDQLRYRQRGRQSLRRTHPDGGRQWSSARSADLPVLGRCD
jgi:transposase